MHIDVQNIKFYGQYVLADAFNASDLEEDRACCAVRPQVPE